MTRPRGAARKSAETAIADLDTWLITKREAGLSLEQISRTLFVETDHTVDVSYRTIARWLNALDQS